MAVSIQAKAAIIGSAVITAAIAMRQKLLYVYYQEEAGRRLMAKILARDQARRIAANLLLHTLGTKLREIKP